MSDYNAGIQNWSIAQDERGVMYFGNNNGLLEFDGSAWRLYELPTKGIVRAIYISCLLYTSPSPRDMRRSRMPSSA